jgi:spermidine synthase
MDVALFTLSISLSAFLLFWVQPLTAKFFLPILGGSPSVWQTCMVFFQGILLLGYGYAHYLSKKLSLSMQMLVHFTLVLAAIASLPLLNQLNPDQLAQQKPMLWLLNQLLHQVALPFFVLSTSTPLLQRWFSYTRHESAADPYYLYAASNLGSLLALLGFPLLLEPLFGNVWQTTLWTWGYVTYAICLLACSRYLHRNAVTHTGHTETLAEPIAYTTKLYWTLLAFIPSSLLLGVTTTITTDIASTPLFWVIPLALYLISFILCFNPRTSAVSLLCNSTKPYIFAALAMFLLMAQQGTYYSISTIVAHLSAFSCVACICHGQLYHTRPAKQALTEFYLWIAVGGFLGGMFNSILAPILFSAPWEYPLILCLSGLFRTSYRPSPFSLKNTKLLLPLLLMLATLLLLIVQHLVTLETMVIAYTTIYAVTVITLLVLHDEPLPFTLQLGLILLLLPVTQKPDFITVYQHRNFFGILKIHDFPSLNLRTLKHGTTMHGIGHITAQAQRHFSYYQPLTEIAKSLPKTQVNRTAVAGLGAGSLACLIPGKVTFYEIDPDVVSIAQNPQYFRYLSQCPPQGGVVIGDARLSLKQVAAQYYDMIVLDAFSSDAVPTHLINEQALELYLSKLKPHGLLAFNISNRHLDLVPVLAAICNKLQLQCYQKTFISKDIKLAFSAKWVFISRKDVKIINTLQTGDWHTVPKNITQPLWTDSYSNIFSVLN